MRQMLSQILAEVGLSHEGEDIEIEGIHTLSQADGSQLSFIDADTYIEALTQTRAAAVLLPARYLPYLPKGVIPLLTEQPYLAVARASKLFHTPPSVEREAPQCGEACQIDPSVVCGRNVTLGKGVTVMAGCVLGSDVSIGADTILYPNVTVYPNCQIGASCILHAGVVIGADGYGFVQDAEGRHVKFYQNGHVIIEDGVEIGANSTVDRATFGATVIGAGTKIDNLVQVAHNCELGEDCLLVCQTALAGSTILGDRVVMGGQSGATGHLRIGDDAVIASRAGVTKSLPGGKVYGGFPAIEQKLWLKMQAALLRLIKKKKE